MGYSTDFTGHMTITPSLRPEHAAYLRKFSETRRMERDATVLQPDSIRMAAGLPTGDEGGYFVGGRENDVDDTSIVNYNQPPAGQPGLWCQWTIDELGRLVWDEGEKFYGYTAWLEYIVEHFLAPWGYSIEGQIAWHGDGAEDRGVIYARGQQVQAVPSSFNTVAPDWYNN